VPLDGKCVKDRLNSARHLSIDLIVPEPHDAIAGIEQMPISRCVVALAAAEPVLPAVNFDNEPGTLTFKVHDVRRNWRLPAKVVAKRSQGTQLHPKLYLLGCHFLSEISCPFVGHVAPPGDFTTSDSPPSPHGEG
jgi:hypothetical protein